MRQFFNVGFLIINQYIWTWQGDQLIAYLDANLCVVNYTTLGIRQNV